MKFVIGFVFGGASIGIAVANWSRGFMSIQLWKSKVQCAVQSKVDSRVAALRAKLP